MIARVQVQLNENPYSIYIGEGALSVLQKLSKSHAVKHAVVIADRKLIGPRKNLLDRLKQTGWTTIEIPVQAGESFKDFKAIYPLYGKLLKVKARRDTVIFALGGGSIGDAVGFIASTYQRGLSWVGVPTTLLAQVDSSIGGKTAINHTLGKNLIGTFHQPSAVISDVSFLTSLSKRERISGLGEAIKYGLIYDQRFFKYVQSHWMKAVAGNTRILTYIIKRSAALKAKTVEKDEFDAKGVREALNFGHTFGHALEKATKFNHFQHGEAVIWGMRFALALSRVKNILPRARYDEMDSFLKQIELPTIPKFPRQLFKHMNLDKKVRNGKLHFVLLKNYGHVISSSDIGQDDLFQAYDKLSP